jgi:hypothetical protein
MAYDRYDTRDAPRDERSRWSEDRSQHRDSRSDRGGRDDRGFFERASDEVSSWFGDEEAERRRREDRMRDQREEGGRGHQEERGNRDWNRERMSSSSHSGSEHGWFGTDNDRTSRSSHDRGWFGSDNDRGSSSNRDRSSFGRDEDRGFQDRGWERGEGRGYSASERDYNPSWRRELSGSSDHERDQDRGRGWDRGRQHSQERGGYRPMAGDYGRAGGHESDQFFAASGYGRGQRGFGDYSRDDDGQSEWGRDPYRQTSRAGTRDWTDRSRHDDPHYSSWRQRHMSDLDRDYEDFRREHQSRFEDDFASWREKRQQKRGLLGQIHEHMEVVGNDGKHVGTIDKVAGDRLILTKSDPESGGAHHSISCSDLDRVEGDRVILDCSSDQARQRWRDERGSRALFEREDQGEMGPRALDRSFSGTYR